MRIASAHAYVSLAVYSSVGQSEGEAISWRNGDRMAWNREYRMLKPSDLSRLLAPREADRDVENESLGLLMDVRERARDSDVAC